MEEHLVSCIIATHNDGKYLHESVLSILGQTHKNIECIVIDDGSTDDTAFVIKRWLGDSRLTYVYQAQSGVGKARNAGVRKSYGRYIAFLDADDRWEENKIRLQLCFLAEHPEFEFCWSDQELMDTCGRPLGKRVAVEGEQPLTTQILTSGWNAPPSCWLVKRDLFEGAGGFDESFSSGEDVEMIFRMAAHGLGARSAETHVWRRVRQNSASRNVQEKREQAARVVEQMLSYGDGEYAHLRRQAMHTVHRVLAGHCYENGAYSEATIEAIRAALWSPRFIFERAFVDTVALGHISRFLQRGDR